jgi:transcriptional regulator with XRE-family HTH domain
MLAKIQPPPKKAANPTDKHVGSKVRLRRLQLQMSQEKLAHKLGLTFQQVQKYEKGANRIGASRLQQIAVALQTPASWFFADLPQVNGSVVSSAPSTAEFDDFLTLPYSMDLVRDYSKLTNQQKDVVARVARALAEGR